MSIQDMGFSAPGPGLGAHFIENAVNPRFGGLIAPKILSIPGWRHSLEERCKIPYLQPSYSFWHRRKLETPENPLLYALSTTRERPWHSESVAVWRYPMSGGALLAVFFPHF